MSSDTPAAAAPKTGGFALLLTASMVSSLIMLDSNIVAVSLPTIGQALHAGFTDVQWVISAYVLTYAALLMATGNFADLYGRKTSMLIGLAVFALASAACGFATNAAMLNAARAVQGVGGAFLLTSSLAIIGHDFSGAERTRAVAFRGAALGMALALGPILGGVITNLVGWRWIFLVNIPLSAGLIWSTLQIVKESRDPDAKKLDWSGIVTFSGALAVLIWALIDGNDDGCNKARLVSWGWLIWRADQERIPNRGVRLGRKHLQVLRRHHFDSAS
jgi:MFS family permease